MSGELCVSRMLQYASSNGYMEGQIRSAINDTSFMLELAQNTQFKSIRRLMELTSSLGTLEHKLRTCLDVVALDRLSWDRGGYTARCTPQKGEIYGQAFPSFSAIKAMVQRDWETKGLVTVEVKFHDTGEFILRFVPSSFYLHTWEIEKWPDLATFNPAVK